MAKGAGASYSEEGLWREVNILHKEQKNKFEIMWTPARFTKCGAADAECICLHPEESNIQLVTPKNTLACSADELRDHSGSPINLTMATHDTPTRPSRAPKEHACNPTSCRLNPLTTDTQPQLLAYLSVLWGVSEEPCAKDPLSIFLFSFLLFFLFYKNMTNF